MTLQELYKLSFQNKLNLNTAIEYITLAAKLIAPDKECDASNIATSLQFGLGDMMIPLVNEAVEKNPEKVGFQVIKVYNKKGQLIKVITEKW